MIFVGGACHTLIVEPSDVIADRLSDILKKFPNNSTSRVRTASEALESLAVNDPPIDQVCVDSQVWSVEQAMLILRKL